MSTLYQIDKLSQAPEKDLFIFPIIYLNDKKSDHCLMTIAEIRLANARTLASTMKKQADFGALLDMDASQVSQIIGRNPTKDIGNSIARRIEAAFNKPVGWMDVIHTGFRNGLPGEFPPPDDSDVVREEFQSVPDRRNSPRRVGDFSVLSADETDKESGQIEYWDARGSCGGGFLNYDQLPKGHLIKEKPFFQRFNLKPENAIAVYADGDSMADFIVDGDIVIFDRSKQSPVSGEIFLIEHPDGLRIKTLRRGIDGSWVLESRNPDKRRFPDERIPPDNAELLKIHGQFIYRQGGY